MSGVVYYTGDKLQDINFGTSSNPSTGILIVHNSDSTALLKNTQGYFKGLIITDDFVHINDTAMVIGGIVLQKSTGNAIGNGDADVLYSSSVLKDLPISNYTIQSWEDTKSASSYTYSS